MPLYSSQWKADSNTQISPRNTSITTLQGNTGGMTIIGGTASGENVTLQSTSNATRGKVLLGSSSAYDEANVRLGIGTASPSTKLDVQSSASEYLQSSGTITTCRGESLVAPNLQLHLENRSTSNGVDTGAGFMAILCDNSTTTAINAGRIKFFKEQTWTTTASTQDAYYSLELAQDGVLAEKIRVTSAGFLGVGNTPSYQIHTAVTKSDTALVYIDSTNNSITANGARDSGTGLVLRHTTSASSASNDLVERVMFADWTNNLTGGGAVTNARCLDFVTNTNASTTTTELSHIYLGTGTTSGTVTTGIGLNISGIQGTTKYGIYDSSGGIWANTTGYLQLGAIAAPTSVSGNIWHDSTQKCLTEYVDGVKQKVTTCLFTATANGAVTNTTTETSLIGTGVGTTTAPANFFVAGKTIRIVAHGYLSVTNLLPTLRIRVKLGSTAVLDTTATTMGSLSDRMWSVSAIITCRTTGATGTVFAQSLNGFFHSYDGVLDATPNIIPMVTTTTTTIDTTASQAIDITAQWDTASATNSITGTNVTIEVLN